MLEKLKGLSSYEVFKWFYELNQIPRGSGNEKQVSDWLVRFAKERNLEVVQDDALNVIIRKKATLGYENAESVILQGHMDMVCEKESDVEHDFLKDPIAFIVEGDFLKADHTTLGADNGIAVAYSLAILDSKEIEHPALEVLFTTSEETGMDGAIALDKKKLQSRTLINIDSEEEGTLLVSCAGGRHAIIRVPIEWEKLSENHVFYSVKVSGLVGGHSGMEIIKQRGSANVLMGRVLYDLYHEISAQLVSVEGGSKHNAIPREAHAIIAIDSSKDKQLEERIKFLLETFKIELRSVDKDVRVEAKAVDLQKKVFTQSCTEKVVDVFMLSPTGVINMDKAMENLVQTSNNLGVIEMTDEFVIFNNAMRSSLKSMKELVTKQFEVIAKRTQSEFEATADYPEWAYNPDSKIRDVFVKVYKEMTGEEPKVDAIHAGLECGLFSEKFDGDIDLISLGPNIYDVHTPKEHASISSIDRTWKYLLEVLKALK